MMLQVTAFLKIEGKDSSAQFRLGVKETLTNSLGK